MDGADNIPLHQILCQVKVKRAEGIGGNSNPVLPFLAVCKGHFGLDAQLPFLYLCNILAAQEGFQGRPAAPLQAHHIYMLPLFPPIPQHMVLTAHVFLVPQCFGNGVLFHNVSKFLAFLGIFHSGAQVRAQIPIRAGACKALILRGRPCQILVGAFFKIHHGKPREQGVHAADNIAHLQIFLFQPFPFPA